MNINTRSSTFLYTGYGDRDRKKFILRQGCELKWCLLFCDKKNLSIFAWLVVYLSAVKRGIGENNANYAFVTVHSRTQAKLKPMEKRNFYSNIILFRLTPSFSNKVWNNFALKYVCWFKLLTCQCSLADDDTFQINFILTITEKFYALDMASSSLFPLYIRF